MDQITHSVCHSMRKDIILIKDLITIDRENLVMRFFY